MRTAAPAAGLALVLAAAVAVVVRRDPPAEPVVHAPSASSLLGDARSGLRADPALRRDTGHCGLDPLVEPVPPVEDEVRGVGDRPLAVGVTVRVLRWADEGVAREAFRRVRDGLRGCGGHDRVEETGIGDEGIRLVSANGDRRLYEVVVRAGWFVLDVRMDSEPTDEFNASALCWARYLVARAETREPEYCWPPSH